MNMNMNMTIDIDDNDIVILLEFFQQATHALEQLVISHTSLSSSTTTSSLSSYDTLTTDIRTIILQKQMECLQISIDTCIQQKKLLLITHENNSNSNYYTTTRLQSILQQCKYYHSNSNNNSTTSSNSINNSISNTSSSTTSSQSTPPPSTTSNAQLPSKVIYAMEHMNDTARKTFCSLLLYYEHTGLYDPNNTTGNTNNSRNLISSSSSSFSSTKTNNIQQQQQQQLQQQHKHEQLMPSSDILEFCALCCTAIHIPEVIQYIQYGNNNNNDNNSKNRIFPNLQMNNNNHNHNHNHNKDDQIFPQQRLMYIQRLLLRSIGYEPEYGTKLIQQMFYTNDTHNSITNTNSNDDLINSNIDYNHVLQTFHTMEQIMEQTLQQITKNITHETFFPNNNNDNNNNDNKTTTINSSTGTDTELNDFNHDDNITRIVAVTYSEKYIDAITGQELIIPENEYDQLDTTIDNNNDAAPHSLVMHHTCCINDAENDTVVATGTTDLVSSSSSSIANDISSLEQEILGELLLIRDEEREIKINEMNEIVQLIEYNMIHNYHTIIDRMTYIQNLSLYEKRCMIMKKIWDTMLLQHNNELPTMR